MATIADLQNKYTEILNGKNAIVTSLENKGVVVPDNIKVKDIPVLIDGISTGFPNGKEWTRGSGTTDAFYRIEYVNGVFIALGAAVNDNNTPIGIYYSTDGKTWIQSNITSGIFREFYYAKGVCIAGSTGTSIYSSDGSLCYSTDGKSWTEIVSGRCNALHYYNGTWLVNMSDALYSSTNGKSWTALSSRDLGLCTHHIANINGLWVVGSSTHGGLYYSSDLKVWTKSDAPSSDCWQMYSNDEMIISSFYDVKEMYYSTDGKTWAPSNFADSLTDIAYLDDVWVGERYQHGIYYSTDGKTWIQSNITSSTGSFGDFTCIDGIKFTYNLSNLYYSTNGEIWETCTLPGIIRSVPVKECGIFLISTSQGVYYSTDGKTWIQSNITSDFTENFICKNGIWVCGSSSTNQKNGLYYSVVWEPTI